MIRIRPKADLIYGASKTRKTSNIGLMAMYVWKKYHKITRLVTFDGGGYDPVLTLVENGIIEVWVPIARPGFTVSTIDLACQGYWPKDPNDPASPLVAPTAATWERVGGYGIEGLTSGGDTIIRQYRADKAHLSQDPSYNYAEKPVEIEGANGKIEKKVITYSGGNQSYYGSGQDQLYDFVIKSHLLPCEKVLWTALEGEGSEEGTRKPTYGPAIIGRKSTGKAPQWFGNCVHVEQLVTSAMNDSTKQLDVIEKPIMYLRTHADALSKIPYPCGTRAPFQFAGELPQYLDPPDISQLYRLLDALNEKMDAEVKRMKDAGDEPPAAPVSVVVPEPPPLPPADIIGGAKVSIEPTKPAIPPGAIQSPAAFIPPRISVKKPSSV